MSDALQHRGPDAGGLWTSDDARVSLGHRRLSIIDLTETGAQPMRSPDGRFTLAYNGELYNYRELRTELMGFGHSFRGTSDTEIMLASFVEWGVEAALQRFNAMFALALYDERSGSLTLARDRFGEKPLYYARVPGGIIFASELKAIRRHPDFRADIDHDAVQLYFRHGYVPAPYSIYRDVRKLPAASFLTLRDGAMESAAPRPYWSLRSVARAGIDAGRQVSDAEACEELDFLLRDAVRLRMIADVPLGAFLSGGIDSSTIVALMQQQSSAPVRTFTVGFVDRRFDEAPFARTIAQHLGTEHTELYVQPDEALALVPQLTDVYDEPFGDSSALPTMLISRLARRHVTVALSGDGGDELFGGYNRYRAGQRVIGKLARMHPWLRRSAAVTAQAAGRVGLGGQRLARAASLLEQKHPEHTYAQMISYWPDSALIGNQVAAQSGYTDPDRWLGRGDVIHRMMFADTLAYLPDDILVKVDRASMAVSLETRIPMLDHRIAELAWSYPLSLKLRDGQSKWLLHQVLRRYVPAAMFERPKTGFGVPLDAWLLGPLHEWAADLTSPERLRADGFLQPSVVAAQWRALRNGNSFARDSLWIVLMFQAWLDTQRS